MESIFDTMKNLGPSRLAVMLLTFFGLIVFFIFISVRSSTPGLTLLYGDLSTSDSTEITAKLDTVSIPYQLSADGKQVLVPGKDVGKARMLLAQEGLPRMGSVGYEIFDQKQSFGTTSFQQNINALRALEGELARTIGAIEQVRTARVHLVLPKRELFSRDTQPATASVFLNLRNAAAIGQEQIMAIQHLIATSVPGLKPANVAIIDQAGNLLAKGEEESSSPGITAGKGDEMRHQYENRLARAIEGMVGRVVGYGRVRANVTADLDFDVVSRNTESYDPDGQVVRSVQSTTEESSDNTGAQAGSVSVENNLPGLPNAAGSQGGTAGSTSSRTEETTNYEITKTIENMVSESGQVNRLSIAVLVDGKYDLDAAAERPEDATADWAPPRTYTPRTEEEMDKITDLVKSAVGYDEGRGDTLQVVNMKFAEGDVVTPMSDDGSLFMGFAKADLLNVAETLSLSIVAVLVILLVLRPLTSHITLSMRLKAEEEALAAAEAAPMLTGQMPPQLSAPAGGGAGMPPGESIPENDSMIDMSSVEGKVKASSVQKISELVTSHPNETVSVIRQWMSQEN